MLDEKIAEVQAQVDKIAPPPVGTIKFSASQDVGDDWLRCDGSFISEQDYPELVAALGKLTPSGDKLQLLSDGEIGPQLSNGALYGGRLWVYSYSDKKLYGVDVEGKQPIKEISLASSNAHFNDFIAPSTLKPICLSIVPHKQGTGAKLFLAQILEKGAFIKMFQTPDGWLPYFLLFCSEFTGSESSLEMDIPFTSIPDLFNSGATAPWAAYYFYPEQLLPYVTSYMDAGTERYTLSAGLAGSVNSGSGVTSTYISGYKPYILAWFDGQDSPTIEDFGVSLSIGSGNNMNFSQRAAFQAKNKGEMIVYGDASSEYKVYSQMNKIVDADADYLSPSSLSQISGPLDVFGASIIVLSYNNNSFPYINFVEKKSGIAVPNLPLPTAARTFVDAGAYLWGKDIYLFFVGTGIMFSRTLQEGDWGYLDTTSILGTITQFGYLDYDQDEGTLYLLGQDTANKVKAAKIVLNTLYDYANDGAWLPMIASDGVPAYIKAVPSKVVTDPVEIQVTVQYDDFQTVFEEYGEVLFEGEALVRGTYTRTASKSGQFDVGIRLKKELHAGTTNRLLLRLNGTQVISDVYGKKGERFIVSFHTSDYLESGITLEGAFKNT